MKERAQLNLSRLYAISQVEYCRNFIFKRHFPIHKLFERGCELGLWRLGADKIAAIFGTRLNRRMRGKLATVIDQIEHGHHAFRAYFKSAFLKQYEKLALRLHDCPTRFVKLRSGKNLNRSRGRRGEGWDCLKITGFRNGGAIGRPLRFPPPENGDLIRPERI